MIEPLEPLAPLDLFAPFRSNPAFAPWVAAYSTRRGGASAPPFDSHNLGFSTGDDPASVRENRQRLSDAVGAPLDAWVVPGQCHGKEVLTVGREDASEGALAPSARFRGFDAVLLAEPGIFALSLSADCPLVVIADPNQRRGGVAHAGWRGTAVGVVEALLEALAAAGSDLTECYAALSPGICGGCFEVGEEVFEAVADLPGARAARDGNRLDLRRIHREALTIAGFSPDRISRSPYCSFEDASVCFSHRRDKGRTGRNGAIVGWRES